MSQVNRARASWRAVAVGVACVLGLGLLAPRARADAPGAEAAFAADLATLTRTPHRLAGSPEGQAAAAHVMRRLSELGVQEVYPLDMPVWQLETERAELSVDGRAVSLRGLRPNVIVPPVTPPEGITGPLIYAGQGRYADYGTRDPRGAIVVLDYDSEDGWTRAFALGARAVIFLGGPEDTPLFALHAVVPANYPRYYLAEGEAPGFDARVDRPEARLDARIVWKRSVGRNVVARVPGTDPAFAPDRKEDEAVVLGVGYDSYGIVPELSPAARGAANVAALLELAGRAVHNPARRHLIFMFLDNQSRGHQGAREVYSALHLEPSEAEALEREHHDELRQVSAMQRLLESQGLAFGREPQEDSEDAARWLQHALQSETGNARDDVRKALSVARLSREAGAPERVVELDRQWRRWDAVRRSLHEQRLADFVDEQRRNADAAEAERYERMFSRMTQGTLERFRRRSRELQDGVHRAEQRRRLRDGLGFTGGDDATWVTLHVDLSLGGGGPRWSFMAGDISNVLFGFRATKPEGDAPGYYGRVLNVVRQTQPEAVAPHLDLEALKDPTSGMSFATGLHVSTGHTAGSYGIYNLSAVTGSDARLRDGHPADTVAHLPWQRLRAQALEAGEVVRAVADRVELSLPRVFARLARSRYPRFAGGRADGNYAGLQVSGSLSEDRPAAGALMAIWPGEQDWKRQAWNSLGDAFWVPSFEPIALETVDENGRFPIVGLRSDLYEEVMTIGALFDDQGRVDAITTTEKQHQRLVETMRVNLIHVRSGQWMAMHPGQPPPRADQLKLMKASSDSLFRDNRALWGQVWRFGFYYLSDQLVDYRLKLFQPRGDVALGAVSAEHPNGIGLAPEELEHGSHLAAILARDLWQLNEGRLHQLRERGVTSSDLERLHARAQRSLELAEGAKTIAAREAALGRSAALSQRVYEPIRSTMDDLVYAIVVLLLLSIPFAFSLERLLIGASGVYGRIGGFAGIFLATFAVLYVLHPGFAIAATPIVVFLAFAILLLSSLVICIVMRKFKAELRQMQGQSAGQHDIEVSTMGTLLAAVSMGMSTMRRRPTRTLLTAVTVVMLTFTILSFASFSQDIGIRVAYEGPAPEGSAASIFLRRLDYSGVRDTLVDTLDGEQGPGGALVRHQWLVREGAGIPHFTLARPEDGKFLQLDAVMGVTPEEIARMPLLSAALGSAPDADKVSALAEGGVYLPPVMRDVLGAKPGDPLLLNGQRVTFAGVHDGALLQRIKHLDGQSHLPVDFLSAATQAERAAAGQATESEIALAAESDRAFVHLSGDQVVLGSPALVRRLGGSVYGISLFAGEGVDIGDLGRRLAEVTVLPVWTANSAGVERMILTRLTSVSGGLALFVPLLLGGLIIFGTLLGSITDREKEIYTFSALGLAPAHVGVLFFAEAAVYACVGGVGGQLLAQAAGLVVSILSRQGVVDPVDLNYSSTNALFATAVVMLTVLVSAIYPAVRASRSANPGVARTWKMPPARGDELLLTFPFTVSAHDITGVVSFLAEHLRRHDDAGLGSFAASDVSIGKSAHDNLELSSELALSPFDLGVTQHMTLTAVPSEIEGVDEVAIRMLRRSGSSGDWYRANRVFLKDLRRQFLVWRTLSADAIETYRRRTLEVLGASRAVGSETSP